MTSVEPDAPRVAGPPSDQLWTVHERDARDTSSFLSGVASQMGVRTQPFITATITSPPYANLVNYGTASQIGFGQSYEEYLSECESIFGSVYDWTKDEGSLWVVADTMMGATPVGGPSSLIPLPFALAERAARAGWTLRDVIVWRKDRTRPWASAGRLRNGFEYILYFVKTGRFKHHVDRLRDLRGLKSWWVKYPERHNPWGMTPDNVWEVPIPVQGSWASNDLRHACPFPDELVRRMVELSTDPGDVVFDPFAGSGMVPAVAEALGRTPLGTEINSEFCRVYADWVRPTILSKEPDPLDVDSLDITGTLLALRVLKFPKTLLNQIMRSGIERSALLAAIVLPDPLDLSPKSSPYASLDCVLVVPDIFTNEDMVVIEQAASRAVVQPPLSRWGVTPRLAIRRLCEIPPLLPSNATLSAYMGGRTWKSDTSVPIDDLIDWIRNSNRRGIPPIISPLLVSVELEN